MMLCWWFVYFHWFIVRLNITTRETLKYSVNSSCLCSIFSSSYADKSFPWSLWTIKSTGCTDVATVKKILMKWVEFSCNFIFTSDKPWLNKIQLLILLFCLICSFSTLHMKRSIYSSTQSSQLRSAAKKTVDPLTFLQRFSFVHKFRCTLYICEQSQTHHQSQRSITGKSKQVRVREHFWKKPEE